MKLKGAILTVSSSRTTENDKSGQYLATVTAEAGHEILEKQICPDNVYGVRAYLSRWIADPECEFVITTGGTGVTGSDGTPEAVLPLLDKTLDGFGEIFRQISYQEIGTSALQSRAIAGIANGTMIFCVPGSTNACRTAWDKIIRLQMDSGTKPCNLATLKARFNESPTV